MSETSAVPEVGSLVANLEVLRPGAEGVAVGRHPDGRVVLVKYALPGEVVDVVITGAGKGGRFLRADAVSVSRPAPDRVDVACPYSHPGGCGGCDLLFATPAAQRRWKSEVVTDQLRRIAGVDRTVEVEAVGTGAATGWRTRVRYAVTEDGRLGLRSARSHDIVPVASCLQTVPEIAGLDLDAIRIPGAKNVVFAAGVDGVVADVWPTECATALAEQLPEHVSVVGVRGSDTVRYVIDEREWQLPPEGFWQVHPEATLVLAEAVRDGLRPRAGEHLLDLYAGAGLFGALLADDLGPGGRIDAVESNQDAVLTGSQTLADITTLKWHVDYVDAWLRGRTSPRRADLVVLDPPRTGAGVEVMRRLIERSPRAIVYVSCDPATFARDLKAVLEAGWTLAGLRAFDLFPATAHTELVATLLPGTRPSGPQPRGE